MSTWEKIVVNVKEVLAIAVIALVCAFVIGNVGTWGIIDNESVRNAICWRLFWVGFLGYMAWIIIHAKQNRERYEQRLKDRIEHSHLVEKAARLETELAALRGTAPADRNSAL